MNSPAIAFAPGLPRRVVKRDGGEAPFDPAKIVSALRRAGAATGEYDADEARLLATQVLKIIRFKFEGGGPGVEQVQDVVGYLNDALPDAHPFRDVVVQPAEAGAPEFWMLGSSDYGAALAAVLGLRFTFAQFITAAGGAAVTRAYRERFRGSPFSTVVRSVLQAVLPNSSTWPRIDR